MFNLKKILALMATAIAVTIVLYYIDSDTPTDNMAARVFNTAIVFGIVTLIYTTVSLLRRKRSS